MKPPDIQVLPVGQMQANCYLIRDSERNQVLIVDPGDDPEYLIEKVAKTGAEPVGIFATHGHFDHLMGAYVIQKTYRCPLFLHKADALLVSNMSDSARHFLGVPYVDPPPDVTRHVAEGDTIPVGDIEFSLLHVPGHTPGSMSLVSQPFGFLIVGDLLFAGGGVGRTDFSYSDAALLRQSVGRILAFPESFVIYPGHGPATTVGNETYYHR